MPPRIMLPGSQGMRDQAGQAMTFRSPTAVIVWVVWLLFAVANWIDLAVQGRDHIALVAAAILLLATGVAYVTAQRPRIIAGDAGITVMNPLRDHTIGWAGVAKVDLADLLRVHCAWGPADGNRKVINAWAVHYSRRRQVATEVKARRAARRAGSDRSGFGMPYGGGGRGLHYSSAAASATGSAEEADAERIVRLLSERTAAAEPEAEAVRADGTADLEPLRSTWSGRAIAALVIPALILLIVSLV